MSKNTDIKINILNIKLFVISLMFMSVILGLNFFIMKSYSNNIVNSINIELFKKAIGNTILIDNLNPENNYDRTYLINLTKQAIEYIIGFNIKKPETIINYQFPMIESYGSYYYSATSPESSENMIDIDENDNQVNEEKKKEVENIKEKAEIIPKEAVSKVKGVTLINETNYNIDLDSIINSTIKIKQEKKVPKVLIYHTHTCESYTPSLKYKYVPSDTDRTSDLNYTVSRVGDELERVLENEYGIDVIHDKTVFDGSSYNSAYTRSEKALKGYMKKYPSISFIIDLHRDAADYNGKKLKVSQEINGKSAAKVMTVIGTDGRGMIHPNWRENLKLGVKFSKKMNDLYPGLSRGINLKLGRFNQYLSNNALLIEVGSNGNTLDESIESTKYIARAISDVLKEAK